MTLEDRIHTAEAELFRDVGAEVEESFLDLATTGARVRLLSHGSGPPLVLLHGVSLSAAAWAPLFRALPDYRLLAPDLPGHGLSDPVVYRRGQVRHQARGLIDDILDALGLDQAPVVGHSLGGMFALWYAAAGTDRISRLVAIGEPAVALPGVRVRMPLSLLTVRGVGVAVLRSPGPRPGLSTVARPRPWSSRGRQITGCSDRGPPPIGPPARERENGHVADALDRPLPPPAVRKRPQRARARRDHDPDDVHLGNRRTVPLRRERPAVYQPDSGGDASRGTRRTRSLAPRHKAQRGADQNPPRAVAAAEP